MRNNSRSPILRFRWLYRISVRRRHKLLDTNVIRSIESVLLRKSRVFRPRKRFRNMDYSRSQCTDLPLGSFRIYQQHTQLVFDRFSVPFYTVIIAQHGERAEIVPYPGIRYTRCTFSVRPCDFYAFQCPRSRTTIKRGRSLSSSAGRRAVVLQARSRGVDRPTTPRRLGIECYSLSIYADGVFITHGRPFN